MSKATFIENSPKKYVSSKINQKRKKILKQQQDVTKQTPLLRDVRTLYVIRAFCPSKGKYAYITGKARSSTLDRIVWTLPKARLYKHKNHAVLSLQVINENMEMFDMVMNPLDQFQIAKIMITMQELH